MLRSLLNRLVGFASIVLGTVLLLVVINWQILTKLKAGVDLWGLARAVRRSTLILQEKERLLDVIERLEDRLDLERSVDLLRWHRHAEAIQDMLNEGIVGDEVRLIERELERCEGELVESAHGKRPAP